MPRPWNIDALTAGPAVGVPEVLAARDDRVAMQRELLRKGGSLVCFNVNIPGAVKNCPLSKAIFEAGHRAALAALGDSLLERLLWDKPTGFTGFYRVALEPRALKRRMTALEQRSPVGRLWDLDVIGPEGPVSRRDLGLPERACLLCGKPGAGCARSRAHTPAELLEKMAELALEAEAAWAGALCREALEAEVSATPKPGLVDRDNNGAHTDMDHPMFLRSAAALEPHFAAMFACGAQNTAFDHLLPALRRLGMAAEADMYRATGGVNTHKGAIFALGLLCGAAGRRFALGLPRSAEAVCADVAQMTAGICAREYAGLETKPNPTKGEQMYLRYGVTGARGEAESGFAAARSYGLPVLRAALEAGWSDNDALVATLCALMARMIDTNVLSRRDMDAAQGLRQRMYGTLWDKARLAGLDRDLTAENISPGGCADMVALCRWLYEYERT